jgi:Immunity protein Imm1
VLRPGETSPGRFALASPPPAPHASMKIQNMSDTIFYTSSSVDAEKILLKRYNQGVNAFLIFHEPKEKPLLLILVKNQIANLHYFPDGEHPGYISVGDIPPLPAQDYTIFFMNSPKEEEHISNDAIVPFADAFAAAKEFLVSTELPHSIEWFEL